MALIGDCLGSMLVGTLIAPVTNLATNATGVSVLSRAFALARATKLAFALLATFLSFTFLSLSFEALATLLAAIAEGKPATSFLIFALELALLLALDLTHLVNFHRNFEFLIVHSVVHRHLKVSTKTWFKAS